MFSTLHALTRYRCPPVGSVIALAAVDPDDLTAQPVWGVAPVIEALSFKPDKGAYDLGIDPTSGEWSDNSQDNNVGDLFGVIVGGRRGGAQVETDWLRNKLRNRAVHIVATMRGGRQRLVTLARATTAWSGGSNRQAALHSLRFKSQMLSVPPWLEDAPPLISPTPIPPPEPPIGGSTDPVVISTSASSYTFTLDAGRWLVGVEVRSTAAQTARVGLTVGGDELGMGFTPANQALVINVNSQPSHIGYPVYLSGLAGSNQIKFWIL